MIIQSIHPSSIVKAHQIITICCRHESDSNRLQIFTFRSRRLRGENIPSPGKRTTFRFQRRRRKYSKSRQISKCRICHGTIHAAVFPFTLSKREGKERGDETIFSPGLREEKRGDGKREKSKRSWATAPRLGAAQSVRLSLGSASRATFDSVFFPVRNSFLALGAVGAVWLCCAAPSYVGCDR